MILFFNFFFLSTLNGLYSNCSCPRNAVITIHRPYGQRKRELSDWSSLVLRWNNTYMGMGVWSILLTSAILAYNPGPACIRKRVGGNIIHIEKIAWAYSRNQAHTDLQTNPSHLVSPLDHMQVAACVNTGEIGCGCDDGEKKKTWLIDRAEDLVLFAFLSAPIRVRLVVLAPLSNVDHSTFHILVSDL